MPKSNSSKKAILKQLRTRVPFARGFRSPTSGEQLSAIGFKPTELPLEYTDAASKTFFHRIPQPTSVDDWLAQYAEEGQSFREYLQENPWFSPPDLKFLRQPFVKEGKTLCDKYPDGKVYITTMGDFTKSGIMFDDLIDYVRRFLCVPVQVLSGLDIVQGSTGDLMFTQQPIVTTTDKPQGRIRKSRLQTRNHAKTKHVQIQVDSILSKLKLIIPKDAFCLIGLTPYDLYGDESDLFIAGMAAGNQRVAVFSLLRYNPALTFSSENWFDIQEDPSILPAEKQHLIFQRSCKLVVHEICHLLGLPHCVYYQCCMNGSGHLQEDFSQPMMLCPVDLHKLQALIGFDVLERYKSLLDFYRAHVFICEAEWTERRIKYLEAG